MAYGFNDDKSKYPIENGVQLHEHFVNVQNVPANGTAATNVPIADLGFTDPDDIVIVSIEHNMGEFRADLPASTSVVVGYSITRDYGANSWVRVVATDKSGSAWSVVGVRLVYTSI